MQMRPYIHRPAQPYNMPPRSSLHMFEITRTNIYVQFACSSSKTIYRFQNPHSLLFVHMSKSIWYTFQSNHLYKHHDLSKHLFIQFESQQGIFFSLMVSFGVIVAHRRNTHWHSLPVKFVELIQKLDLRCWLSVGLALFYHSFMICIYKCLPFCVFVTKNDHFLEKVNWAPYETHKMGTFSIRSVSQFQHRA